MGELQMAMRVDQARGHADIAQVRERNILMCTASVFSVCAHSFNTAAAREQNGILKRLYRGIQSTTSTGLLFPPESDNPFCPIRIMRCIHYIH